MRSVYACGVRGSAVIAFLIGSAVAPVMAPTGVGATPNHAHLHYQIGVRAYAGSRHAAMLHWEATHDSLDLHLALDDAVEMRRTAAEISAYARSIQEAMDGTERAAAGEYVAGILKTAEETEARAARLGDRIAAASSLTPALSGEIKLGARALFAAFQSILSMHKQAEKVLGIPVPPDPPAP